MLDALILERAPREAFTFEEVRAFRRWGLQEDLLQKLGLLMTLEITAPESKENHVQLAVNLSNRYTGLDLRIGTFVFNKELPTVSAALCCSG